MSDCIISNFYQKMRAVRFETYGVLDSDDKIHTLETDSKIIGRLFEMFAQPVLEQIASENGYILKTPRSQTVYPDFIMMRSEDSPKKIAIDIKTTYVTSDRSTIKFTLGAFGSYMRNNTKNIEYKYTDYAKHYVIGFIYKRNDAAQESRVYSFDHRNQIVLPYRDVKYFISEKYKIAGDRPGSGNTENIGSFPTHNFNDLKEGKGPFSELGQDIFDLYWKYYPKYRISERYYTSLSGFLEWLPQNIHSVELFHDFDSKKVLENIQKYKSTHTLIK